MPQKPGSPQKITVQKPVVPVEPVEVEVTVDQRRLDSLRIRPNGDGVENLVINCRYADGYVADDGLFVPVEYHKVILKGAEAEALLQGAWESFEVALWNAIAESA